jgi:RNA polymerase sigma-70 factor (ECF subfamily)
MGGGFGRQFVRGFLGRGGVVIVDREQRERRLLASYEESGVYLFEQTYGRLVHVARSLGAESGHAEDIVQEALTTLYEKRPIVSRPEAWLVRVVRRRCADLHRRRKRESRLLDRLMPAIAVEQPVDSLLTRRLLHALRRLPARMQALVRRRYFEGHSEATAARLAGYAPNSFKRVMNRALRRLRAAMRPTVESPAIPGRHSPKR